jgi:DNA repair exonuclease SbcCD ATPase subunit
MIVTNIELQDFMSHANTELALPKRGIVLVTGPNGAGKSSLIEGVSMAVWGETIRGSSPWAKAKGGQCVVAVEDGARTLHVHRSQSSNPRLSFYYDGEQPTKFETTGKAQEELERIVRSHEVWWRSHVLSSSDTEAFGRAKDSDRKRLLETILSLHYLESASRACRDDLAECERAAAKCEAGIASTEERVRGLEARLADAEEYIASIPPVVTEDQVEELDALRARCVAATARKSAAQRAFDEANAYSVRAAADLRLAQQKNQAAQTGKCSACGATISLVSINDARDDLTTAKKATVEAQLTVTTARNALDAARGELEGLRSSESELDEKIAEAQRAKQRRDKARAKYDGILASLEDAQDEVLALKAELEGHGLVLAELKAADKILSTKGVRAHLLSDAIESIEMVANSWLAMLAGSGTRLTLEPYSQKASGGVKDAIGMEVVGLSGGRSYKSASGGERRRVDLAISLALGEVASAAVGAQPGTMWIDEAFDNLDEAGRTAASMVLSKLAETRCVVVISHDAGLELDGVVHRVRIGGGHAA